MAFIPDPKFLYPLTPHRQAINWLSFSPNSQHIASASDDKTVAVSSLIDSNHTHKLVGHKDIVTSVCFASNYIVSASKDCTARLWRIDDEDNDGERIFPDKESLIYRDHVGTIRSVDISLDEKQICTASDDKMLRFWSPTSNRCITKFQDAHSNWIRCAKFSRHDSSNLLASCGDDGTIKIWDLRGKDLALSLSCKSRSPNYTCVQWNPLYDHILASSSTDSCARVWDLRSYDALQTYQVHNGTITSVDFHESGKYLLTSSIDSSWKIMDIFEGLNMFTGRQANGPLNCVRFSSDGLAFATASKEITLWKSNLPSTKDSDSQDEMNPYDMPEVKNANDYKSSSSSSSSSTQSSIPTLDNYLQSNSNSLSGNHDDDSGQSKIQDVLDENKFSNSTIDLNPDCRCMEFVKDILTHFQRLTDSIIELDVRLCEMEKKVKKIDKKLR